MKPKVYSIDVDGTLTLDSCWTDDEVLNAKPNKEAIEKVNELYQHNFIVLHTARRHELYYPTVLWAEKHGVRYHAVRFEKMPCDELFDLDAINRVGDL